MTSINIFVGSSWEMKSWREAIGDAIRQINDEQEPVGYRVCMKCWEDFHPEYTGERKQDEYDRELVEKSQIFIALFCVRCGEYTREEVRIGKSVCPDWLFVYTRPTADDNSPVVQFLSEEKLSGKECLDEDALVAELRAVVDKYIAEHPAAAAVVAKEERKVYVTIPEDRKEERTRYGNMVRGIDDICERWLNLRCRLAQKGLPYELGQSDYYNAILKDVLSAEDKLEICEAVSLAGPGSHPQAALLYCNPGDRAISSDTALSKLAERTFSESFDSYHRIKYNLLVWILGSTLARIDDRSGLQVKDDWITFFNQRIAPLAVANVEGGSDSEKLAGLLMKIASGLLCKQVSPADADASLEDLSETIEYNAAALHLSEEVGKEAIRNLLDADAALAARQQAIVDGGLRVGNAPELVDVTARRQQLQQQLAGYGRVGVHDLMHTQMFMVMLHDTFPEQYAACGLDVDDQYKIIAETADKFEIKDPTVEMMRMNYANSFARRNEIARSLLLYETAISNLDEMDAGSVLVRSYIVHLYVTYINQLSSIGAVQKALDTINRLEGNVRNWNEQYVRPETQVIADAVRIMSCRLRIRPMTDGFFETLKQAGELFSVLTAKVPWDDVPYGVWDELFCDFPNCMGASYVDMMGPCINPEYFNKAVSFFSTVISNAEKGPVSSEYLRWQYIGDACHNLGFLYNNSGLCQYARMALSKALDFRRRLYEKSGDANAKASIAETLLNLCATYVLNLNVRLSPDVIAEIMPFAEECLSIYQEMDNEHYLEQETDVYKAKMMIATIKYLGSDSDRLESMSLFKECKNWSDAHPENSYKETFDNIAGSLL